MVGKFILAMLLTVSWSTTAYAEPPATPQEVYLEYHETLKNTYSDQDIWPFYTQSYREEFERKYTPAMRNKAFFLMKNGSPREVEVVKQSVNGEVATLELRPADVEGSDAEGFGPSGLARGLQGMATLRLEGGQWKLEDVVWQQS